MDVHAGAGIRDATVGADLRQAVTGWTPPFYEQVRIVHSAFTRQPLS
ncbi:hypothetical protein [Stenotrophomonas sp. PD6]